MQFMSMGLDMSCPCCYRPGGLCQEICVSDDIAKSLEGLRGLMKALGVDAYAITAQDAHNSEYVAKSDQRRAFLTGFAGSAGTALITASEALLWTDSRYFLEAERVLEGSEWQLMKQFQPGVLELDAWVLANLEGKVVGVDPTLLSCETASQWKGTWGSRVTLKEIQGNLVDAVWLAKPEDPPAPIAVHPLDYAGETVASKIERVREACGDLGADAVIVSALDQVAWLFNLRGADIECNPVFFAYAAVTQTEALLFPRALDEGRQGLTDEVRAHLHEASVTLKPYSSFFEEVGEALSGKRVLVEPSSCSLAALNLVPPDFCVQDMSPVERFKAIKNDKEIEGLRRASHRDSQAICEFFSVVEQRVKAGGDGIDECAAAELIKSIRAAKPLCVGDSFPTISSVGSNAAIIHYRPEQATCKQLSTDEVYLCDTGAQFLDGTTDITRTVHFGEPTAEQRRCYTRVLQGHIALAAAVFPAGTPGIMLDTLARQALWQDGLNYGHGTGHGMGAYLNVHEGPFGIGGGSTSAAAIKKSERQKRVYLEPMQAGHFVSNEPGCYKDGEFGIRIESDMVAVPADTLYQMGGRPFVRFEYLTLVPMCRELIDTALMIPREIEWVNQYHSIVRDAMKDSLTGAASDWLQRNTEPIGVP